ncbi:hypothetical protein [Mesorhizobium sp. M8A.F.Ca.ET.165.01.1.1]|uniref:hypothetical protein n=1 Tax=Mesorhizobium sp. M8A.F.Ca.ET.165.01.1.1 TaxID=2563960 RepID=UPI00109402F0|nr:hypothetical protein [Mesorhizobium sp. M8A.F.Ca.ET.165.01.1.1]TGT42798.1 hypothetical protein EN808_13020 [Mesorhizobium sp. M8A.F.Ca.ET.165.01.1.1]
MANFPDLKNNKPKFTSLEVAAGLFVSLFVLNYLSVYVGWRPFLYCWLMPIVWPVYDAFEGIISLLAIGLLFFGIVTKRYKMALTAAGALILVKGLPQFGAILFRWGGSCG